MQGIDSSLRFIKAAQVDTSLGNLHDIPVHSSSAGTVGKLDGIVVDPAERQVCYFVIASRRRLKSRRYLMPFTVARIDSQHWTVEIDLEQEDLDCLPEVRSEAIPPFSDEDLITAMFSSSRRDAPPEPLA
jgi:PRC-barrel domain